MMRKLVLVDIDGTLMGADQTIPESAAAACRSARKNGHLVYICTGRPLGDISGKVTDIGFDGIVSAGGARIDAGGGGCPMKKPPVPSFCAFVVKIYFYAFILHFPQGNSACFQIVEE